MKPRQLLTITTVCVAVAWCAALDAAGVELGRGRRIILDRGLQLTAMACMPTFDFDVDQWITANFTTINFQTDAPLHPILLARMPADQQWGRWTYDNSRTLASADLPYVDNFVTIQYEDEMDGNFGKPNLMDILPTVAAQYRQWNTLYPNTMADTSAYGGQLTTDQLRTYVRTCQPDLLTYEYFPGYYATRETFYSEMQKYRTVALEGYDGTGNQPIPYFQQSQGLRILYSDPLPGESFVRWQQFSSWAFGFTGVTLWMYGDTLQSPAPGQDTNVTQVFASRGFASPTCMFGYLAESNRESQNLGPALVRMVSTDIRLIRGKINGITRPSVSGVSAWASGAQNTGGYTDYITGITPLGKDLANPSSTTYSDVLVGYFKPLLSDNSDATFVDGLHFMIVNGNAGGLITYTVNGQPFRAMGLNIPVDANGVPDAAKMAANSASAMAEWYQLAFDFQTSGYDSLVRLSRDTGQVELVPLVHTFGSQYYLNLNLPGGTGDLFAFWNSSNPLPTISASSDMVWTGVSATTTWGTAIGLNNWNRRSGNAAADYADGRNVTFDDAATGTNVNISGGNVSPGNVVFNNSTKNFVVTGSNGIVGNATVTKKGTGKVTLNSANTYTGLTTVEAGTLELGLAAQSPVLACGGADIKGGKVILNYTGGASPAAAIKTALATSYGAGFGAGQLKSTTADGTHGLGWAEDTAAKTVTVARTLYGDASLNGTVDGVDLGKLVAAYNQTDKVWADGDFNYDGVVDGVDLGKLVASYNQSIGSLSTSGGASVPEPNALSLLASACLGLFGYASVVAAAFRKRHSPQPKHTTVLSAHSLPGKQIPCPAT